MGTFIKQECEWKCQSKGSESIIFEITIVLKELRNRNFKMNLEYKNKDRNKPKFYVFCYRGFETGILELKERRAYCWKKVGRWKGSNIQEARWNMFSLKNLKTKFYPVEYCAKKE